MVGAWLLTFRYLARLILGRASRLVEPMSLEPHTSRLIDPVGFWNHRQTVNKLKTWSNDRLYPQPPRSDTRTWAANLTDQKNWTRLGCSVSASMQQATPKRKSVTFLFALVLMKNPTHTSASLHA